MWNLGFQEVVIIFIIALVIFGPRKLPDLGKSLGKSLAEFKRGVQRVEANLGRRSSGRDRRVEEDPTRYRFVMIDSRRIPLSQSTVFHE